MARTADEIEAEALNLPEADRARVFESLLLSFQAPEDDEITRAWAEEAERRDQAMESGEEPGIPAEEVFRKAQERRRETLAASAEQARRELSRGEVQRGTVDDLMAELAE
ncbi:MAG: addiction module protein [Thermoanaerobaculia bacterium]